MFNTSAASGHLIPNMRFISLVSVLKRAAEVCMQEAPSGDPRLQAVALLNEVVFVLCGRCVVVKQQVVVILPHARCATQVCWWCVANASGRGRQPSTGLELLAGTEGVSDLLLQVGIICVASDQQGLWGGGGG